jgi:putative transposase
VNVDFWSRYLTGRMLARAERLIGASIVKQCIAPGQLTLHSDRGSPMTA